MQNIHLTTSTVVIVYIYIYIYIYILYIISGAHNDESVRVGAVNNHAFN